MSMMRTSNPALGNNTFSSARAQGGQDVMTIQGTVNKTLFLLFCTMMMAGWAWSTPQAALPLTMPALIAGFIIALVTVFKKEWAAVTAPLYAVVEGVILGSISLIFEKSYPGIVSQAVTLTFGVLFSLLLAYKFGFIRATENFKLGIFAATGGIALLYFINFVMGFFGKQMNFIYAATPIGIGFSVIVVIIAALNLVLDFDFIENGAEQGAPKYMEWYGAFGLMVTLIWLYLEILRLLSKMRRRD